MPEAKRRSYRVFPNLRPEPVLGDGFSASWHNGSRPGSTTSGWDRQGSLSCKTQARMGVTARCQTRTECGWRVRRGDSWGAALEKLNLKPLKGC